MHLLLLRLVCITVHRLHSCCLLFLSLDTRALSGGRRDASTLVLLLLVVVVVLLLVVVLAVVEVFSRHRSR